MNIYIAPFIFIMNILLASCSGTPNNDNENRLLDSIDVIARNKVTWQSGE